MRFITDANPQLVDEFVAKSEQNSFLQQSKYQKFKIDWPATMTAMVDDDDNIIASAIVYQIPFIPGKYIIYVPNGPVVDYENKALVKAYIDNLRTYAMQRNAVAFRFDPNLAYCTYLYKDKDDEGKKHYRNQEVVDFLKSLGALHTEETHEFEDNSQPRFNIYIDLENYNSDDYIGNKNYSAEKDLIIDNKMTYAESAFKLFQKSARRYKAVLGTNRYYKRILKTYENQSHVVVAGIDLNKKMQKLNAEIKLNDDKAAKSSSSRKSTRLKLANQDLIETLDSYEKYIAKEKSTFLPYSAILNIYNESFLEVVYLGINNDIPFNHTYYKLIDETLKFCLEHNLKKCWLGCVDDDFKDMSWQSEWPITIEESVGEFNIVLNENLYINYALGGNVKLYNKLIGNDENN